MAKAATGGALLGGVTGGFGGLLIFDVVVVAAAIVGLGGTGDAERLPVGVDVLLGAGETPKRAKAADVVSGFGGKVDPLEDRVGAERAMCGSCCMDCVDCKNACGGGGVDESCMDGGS